MKRFGFVLLLFSLVHLNSLDAQLHVDDPTKPLVGYFVQRALEDAVYEQSYSPSNVHDEIDFWADQKRYEMDLKNDNEIGYSAYMSMKKNAYQNHSRHCDKKCRHSEIYFKQISSYLNYKPHEYLERKLLVSTRSNSLGKSGP